MFCSCVRMVCGGSGESLPQHGKELPYSCSIQGIIMQISISKERARRWFVFFLSLFFMGNGIAIVTSAQLGTTPISSVPYVVAEIFGISMGMGTFLFNVLMLLGQIPLLGSAFRLSSVLQLPCIFVFGVFIDLGMWISHFFIPEAWYLRMTMSLAGCAILAFGIMLELASSTTVIPGEGFVLALAYRTRLPFGNLKVINDVSLVCLAALLSWIYLGGIQGLGEGTVVAAVLTGVFIRIFSRFFRKRIERWF